MRYPLSKLMLAELCSWQCTQEEICASYEKTRDEMNAWCIEECGMDFEAVYKKFTAYGRARIREMSFALAETSAEMAIWLEKQYLGQNN